MEKTWEVAFSEDEKRLILREYRRLLRSCGLDPKTERPLARKAFRFALRQHQGARRKSGEPYILHPLAVAQILVKEIGLRDPHAIAAALLHDVVEDTSTEIEVIETQFGSTVARLVEGLTKSPA
jgi:guanosine-3',5'-bis(diphosphate) 3'-pyrophosphohydrolase